MIDMKKGLVHAGSWGALRAAMARAQAGERLAVGFIGGSITQGSLSSTPDTCYAALVARWWAEHYPQTEYINAGIGGTTSQFGAARVQEDLLCFRPDVVFIEFSVNDENTPHFQETYEGLVRRVLASGAAAVLIHNVCYDTGISAEEVHSAIGRHYGLPCVSMKTTIYPEVASGRLPNREITPDDLHPNDAGHRLVADAVISLLEQVYASQVPAEPVKELSAPMTDNAYEKSIRHRNNNSSPELSGFVPDNTPQEDIRQMFRLGYTAWHAGDSIRFRVEGSELAVQYRKSVRKPTPVAAVFVDGKEMGILDGNFQEDWGDCLYLQTILEHGQNTMHEVEVRIRDAHADDAVPFYLVSVISSMR